MSSKGGHARRAPSTTFWLRVDARTYVCLTQETLLASATERTHLLSSVLGYPDINKHDMAPYVVPRKLNCTYKRHRHQDHSPKMVTTFGNHDIDNQPRNRHHQRLTLHHIATTNRRQYSPTMGTAIYCRVPPTFTNCNLQGILDKIISAGARERVSLHFVNSPHIPRTTRQQGRRQPVSADKAVTKNILQMKYQNTTTTSGSRTIAKRSSKHHGLDY